MNILLLDFMAEHVAEMSRRFPAVVFTALAKGETRLPNALPDAMVAWTRAAFDDLFTPENWAKYPTIRWYHAPGAGVEHYLHPGLSETPFILTNGKLIQGPEVAEHAVALLLALTRRLTWSINGKKGVDVPRAIELRGKTAVVIGFGGVGMLIGERLASFGMKVHAVTEDNFPFLSFVERRWMSDELIEALPFGDAVIVAAPLTERSRRMINVRAFSTMKKGSYFINISRGGLVDTDALVAALQSGQLAAAGLDVTDPEPLPEGHPLLSMANVTVIPHMAGISDKLRERNFDLISTNIRRFVAGLPLLNVVDKVRGY
jgi:phosphoglycerate dehydrogenase-like enzyme